VTFFGTFAFCMCARLFTGIQKHACLCLFICVCVCVFCMNIITKNTMKATTKTFTFSQQFQEDIKGCDLRHLPLSLVRVWSQVTRYHLCHFITPVVLLTAADSPAKQHVLRNLLASTSPQWLQSFTKKKKIKMKCEIKEMFLKANSILFYNACL